MAGFDARRLPPDLCPGPALWALADLARENRRSARKRSEMDGCGSCRDPRTRPLGNARRSPIARQLGLPEKTQHCCHRQGESQALDHRQATISAGPVASSRV